MRNIWGALILALAAGPGQAAMVLDGRLDEPQWQDAPRVDAFQTTEPYTLGAPELATQVRVLALPDGLYIGFICDQPPSIERSRTIGQRDQFVQGDRVNAMIDFDGSGTTAYEFTVLLGGAQQDSVISRQSSYNYDWDGDWSYAVFETDTQWFVEYRIPWSIAPLGDTQDGRRTLGVFFSRVVSKTGRRYSVPGHAFSRGTFVADMHKLQVEAHSSAQLDLLPYGAVVHDVLAPDTQSRAGLDVVWKPNGQHQVVATVNPDFGQVESDQLVVNFSAIPSFFADKRPFFTENLDLFSTDFNVLYTRRMGARPDAGTEGASDILGALKYTGGGSNLKYGVIAAFEDDSSAAEGRDFFIGRARYKLSDALTLGLMGTHVERPTLDRQASVGALDFAWTLAPGIQFGGQGLVSDVDRTPTGTFADFLDPAGTGRGFKGVFRYSPGGLLESSTYLVSKDPRFNINDAGYQSRPDEHVAQTINTFFWRDWAESSSIQQQAIETNLLVRYNDHGERRPAFGYARWQVSRRDTRAFGLQYQGDTIGGENDLLTQGNGNVKLPVTHRLDAFYRSSQSGLFRYYTQLGIGNSYYEYTGFNMFYMEPGLYPSDQFSITAVLEFYNWADNPIWDRSSQTVGIYDYEQQYASINVNWFPVPRHDLRFKFQWVGVSAGILGAYLPDSNGKLQPTGDVLSDFSFTTTAMQLRYRYEFAPQSELFLVYSRGAFEYMADTERNQASALRRGLAAETDSNFLLKLRYRFSILD